jgi:hypothetical protein
MIPYGRYTLQQVIDEVIVRAGRHRTPENVDWYTLASYVYQGLEYAMMIALPLKEWAFTTTLQVTHQMLLDINFISPIRVMLSSNGGPPYREARRIDVKEWFTIQDPERKQIWNQSTYDNPTYMIWGRVLYLHPSNTWDYNVVGAVSGFMDCYMIPPRIYSPNAQLRLPYEYEELVILLALEKVLYRTVDNAIMQEIASAIQKERMFVIEQYINRRQSQQRALESFVLPEVPLVPPAPVPGELPQRLI